MKISLQKVGKRYNREWIFRNCSYEFVSGKSYAITGPNGSGKSTLLQVIAGSLTHNEGDVQYLPAGQAGSMLNVQCPADKHYEYISIVAPYLELIEEMTATELLGFHAKFKPLINTVSIAGILQIVGLENAASKQLRYFSSGMKQRLKLAQAFFSDTPVLLLDEPTTNLDEDGIVLYHQLINEHTSSKLVIVSSNDWQEYDFCEAVIPIGQYKS